jgi:hypothetical protein
MRNLEFRLPHNNRVASLALFKYYHRFCVSSDVLILLFHSVLPIWCEWKVDRGRKLFFLNAVSGWDECYSFRNDVFALSPPPGAFVSTWSSNIPHIA